MAFTFRVGKASSIFGLRLATRLESLFKFQFGDAVIGPDPGFYESPPIDLDGWTALQDLAVETLGEVEAENILAVEGARGVWIPVETPVGEMTIDNGAPLEIGSLAALIRELEQLAAALGLPTADDAVARVDGKPHVRAFAELTLAAHHARRRSGCLWLVV